MEIKMVSNKKGQVRINQRIVNVIMVIITIIVLFNLFSALVPEAQSAGDSLSDSTKCSVAGGFFNSSQSLCLNGTNPEDTAQVTFDAIPIASIFSSTGVVILLLMILLLIGILGIVLPKRR